MAPFPSPKMSPFPSPMDYNKLKQPSQLPNTDQSSVAKPPHRRTRRIVIISSTSLIFLLISAASISLLFKLRHNNPSSLNLPKPSEAISHTCGFTRFPELCITSLVAFPGALEAQQHELVPISVNITLTRVNHAAYSASAIVGVEMDTRARAAYEDCMELMADSGYHLSNSLNSIQAANGGTIDGDDVMTWLSAAVTSHDTCQEGMDTVTDENIKNQMIDYMKDTSELASNSLAIFANTDYFQQSTQTRKRKLLGFPEWVTEEDRRLIEAKEVVSDIVVAKDGSGDFVNIGDAVKKATENSNNRVVIYVKAGRYNENIKIGRKKTNLMIIGDGMGKTVVVGTRSVANGFTTFRSATFAATGAGFIMRDMTIENWSGPEKHQAVALRIGADRSVIYRCSINGYQDTLYVHSQRQFYRECDISGTVDFICGNAAVVLQKCNIWARKPLPEQKNTITAQNRKDPNQNTGISMHECKILPTSELKNSGIQTYLGRPWKMYSRTVVMMSYIDGHVDPAGWLEWNGDFALDTLYYGEYMNYGPGAAVGKRVTWPGYRVIKLAEEASKFTVAEFIYGSKWLPATGVAFLAGLQV